MPAPPPVETLRGRAVHYLDTEMPGPKLGIGTRNDRARLRIGIDDDHGTVEIDRPKRRITFKNDAPYADEQIVADVVLPAWTESASGRAPASVHAVFRKKKDKLHTAVYAHVVTREKVTKVDIEYFDLVLSDGNKEEVVLSKQQAEKAIMNPGLAAKAANMLMEFEDNLAKPGASTSEPKPTADITVALGVGPAAKKILRAQLFKNGADAELRFSALSHLVPKYIVVRDQFLYGTEAASALAEVRSRGLKKDETMTIAVKDGKGSVSFGKNTSDLPAASDSIRDFLQTAALGMLLAHQAKLDA